MNEDVRAAKTVEVFVMASAVCVLVTLLLAVFGYGGRV
jgi:hypothetical protein